MELTETQGKRIVANVRHVFTGASIGALNKQAYNLIIMHMGHIAHFDLAGFQESYDDLRLFAHSLQTSEYSQDDGYNQRRADELTVRYDVDPTNRGCGQPPTVTAAIRSIVSLAQEFEPEMQRIFGERERDDELALAQRIANKHGVTITSE